MCTASPVPLYPPFNTLKPVAENLWIADGGLIRMAMGIVSIPFSTRMTVVRLADGSLWLHSPIAPDDGLCAELEALGKIRHLVSPNYLHYAHIATWQARYPRFPFLIMTKQSRHPQAAANPQQAPFSTSVWKAR